MHVGNSLELPMIILIDECLRRRCVWSTESLCELIDSYIESSSKQPCHSDLPWNQ